MIRLPRRVGLWGRDAAPFRLCGLAGLIAASAVALGLCASRHRSIPDELVLIATAVCVFLALAVANLAVTGRERLVYYHHEIAVLTSVAVVAALLRAPVLGHLDATAAGLGAFLACGRVGCLFAGCCHGRRARWGVIYGPEHADGLFPSYLVDVPLVPVQAIEAVCAAVLVAVCVVVVPATPGAAFGTYVTGYALLRFGLELIRGDPVRHYWRGLSEAQWTSLFVVSVMTALAVADVVPGLVEHLAALSVLVGAGVVVAHRPSASLLHPRHVREIAESFPDGFSGRAQVVETSRGIRMSGGVTDGISHYTITCAHRPLRDAEATDLACVITWLADVRGPTRIVTGVGGSYHLLVGEIGERLID